MGFYDPTFNIGVVKLIRERFLGKFGYLMGWNLLHEHEKVWVISQAFLCGISAREVENYWY